MIGLNSPAKRSSFNFTSFCSALHAEWEKFLKKEKRKEKHERIFAFLIGNLGVTKYFEAPCCFLSSFWGVIFLPTITKGVFISGNIFMLNSSCSASLLRGRGQLLLSADLRWFCLIYFGLLNYWEWQWDYTIKLSHPAYILAQYNFLWLFSRGPLFFLSQQLIGLARLNPPHHSFNGGLCARCNTDRCQDCCVRWGRGEQDVGMNHGRKRVCRKWKEMETILQLYSDNDGRETEGWI